MLWCIDIFDIYLHVSWYHSKSTAKLTLRRHTALASHVFWLVLIHVNHASNLWACEGIMLYLKQVLPRQRPSVCPSCFLACSYNGPAIPLFMTTSPTEVARQTSDITVANADLPKRSETYADSKAQWPPFTKPATIELKRRLFNPPNAARRRAMVFRAPRQGSQKVLQERPFTQLLLTFINSICLYNGIVVLSSRPISCIDKTWSRLRGPKSVWIRKVTCNRPYMVTGSAKPTVLFDFFETWAKQNCHAGECRFP